VAKRINVIGVKTDGEKVVYVVFEKDGEVMPDHLFRLQYPGNKRVAEWKDSIMTMEDENLKYSSSFITNKFFSECVFPVTNKGLDYEAELIEKYGENKGGKPKFDDIKPYLAGAWQKLQSSFLSGDLFLEVVEPEPETSDRQTDPGRSKKKNRE
jgi:hypothetical protein